MNKQKAIEIIQQTNNKYLNFDQKIIAVDIINSINDQQDAQPFLDFIMKRTGLGFKFDVSPEIPLGRIAFLKEEKNMEINTDSTSKDNFLIIGDNFDALKNLLITHEEKIDIIYIDPPYNTESAKKNGNESSKEGFSSKFVYKDKFGHNGWLNMINDRLQLAKRLLSKKGVIMVSLDDNEQAYFRVLMDQIFTEDNFIVNFIWNKTAQGTTFGAGFKRTHEHVVIYSKGEISINPEIKIFDPKKYKYSDDIGNYAITNALNSINSTLESNRNRGYTIYYNSETKDCVLKKEYDKSTLVYDEKFDYELLSSGYTPIRPGKTKNLNNCWNWSEERFLRDYKKELVFKKNSFGNIFPYHKNRFNGTQSPFSIMEFDPRKTGSGLLNNILDEKELKFENPKPVDLIKWLIKRFDKKNSIVLDFFAGSGTTGQAVMELNHEDDGERSFILVSNKENCDGKNTYIGKDGIIFNKTENECSHIKEHKNNICPKNLAMEITYERLHRIILRKKTKNEDSFPWLEKTEKEKIMQFDSCKLKVFNVEHADISLNNAEKIEELILKVSKSFKVFDKNYNKKNINLYYDLSALNIYKKDETN